MKGSKIFTALVVLIMILSTMVVINVFTDFSLVRNVKASGQINKDGSTNGLELTCGEIITFKIVDNSLNYNEGYSLGVWNETKWIKLESGTADYHGDIEIDFHVPWWGLLGMNPLTNTGNSSLVNGQWNVRLFNTSTAAEMGPATQHSDNVTLTIGNMYNVTFTECGSAIDYMSFNKSYGIGNKLGVTVKNFTGTSYPGSWETDFSDTSDEDFDYHLFLPTGVEISTWKGLDKSNSWEYQLSSGLLGSGYRDSNNYETFYWINVSVNGTASGKQYSNVSLPCKLNVTEYVNNPIPDTIIWGDDGVDFYIKVTDGNGVTVDGDAGYVANYDMALYAPTNGGWTQVDTGSTISGYYSIFDLDTSNYNAGTWYVGTYDTSGSYRIRETEPDKASGLPADFIPYLEFEVSPNGSVNIVCENTNNILNGTMQTLNVSIKNSSLNQDVYDSLTSDNFHITGLYAWNSTTKEEFDDDDIVCLDEFGSTSFRKTKTDENRAYYEFEYWFNNSGDATIIISYPGNYTNTLNKDSFYSDTYNNEYLSPNWIGNTTFDVGNSSGYINDINVTIIDPSNPFNQTLTVGIDDQTLEIQLRDTNGNIIEGSSGGNPGVSGYLLTDSHPSPNNPAQILSFEEQSAQDKWVLDTSGDNFPYIEGTLFIEAVNNSGELDEHRGNTTIPVELATIMYSPSVVTAATEEADVEVQVSTYDAVGNPITENTNLYINLHNGTNTTIKAEDSPISLDSNGEGTFNLTYVGEKEGYIYSTFQSLDDSYGNYSSGVLLIDHPDLIVSPSTIDVGETTTIQVQATDDQGDPIEGLNLTLIGNPITDQEPQSTDSDGEVSFSITPSSIGIINVTILINLTFDGDYSWDAAVITDTTISCTIGSGDEGNDSPVISSESPQNNSDIQTDTSFLSVSIEDPEGDNFNWSIETYPNIGSNSSSNDINDTKICPISGLQIGESYIWYVNTTDSGSNNWTNETYYFTVSSSSPGENAPPIISNENPFDGASEVSPGLSELMIDIDDPEGDTFDWMIETYPNINTGGPSSGSDESNGSFSCSVWNLEFDTTYYWFVNTTDSGSNNWTNETFYFTTESEGGDPPDGPGFEEDVNVTVVGTVYQQRSMLTISNVNVIAYLDNDPSNILNTTMTDYNGEFELDFVINQSIYENNTEVYFIFSSDGYVTNDNWHYGISNIIYIVQDQDHIQFDMIELEKIWNITVYINGTIVDFDSLQAVQNASVFIEGPNYFENDTQTDINGSFSVGCISGDAGDFELMFSKEGYFTNASEINQSISDQNIDLGTLYMEIKPPSNAFIEGYLTCDGSPIKDANIMLYDEYHPYESEKGFFDMPTTDTTGYYNISTYPGNFSLITLAKIIGESMESPPLGIGGYLNQVIDVNVSANHTIEQNVSLSKSDSDNITVNLNIVNTSFSYAQLSRTITCNPQILRVMTDSNLDGNISYDEADTLKSSINSSFTQSGFFEEDMLLANIPFMSYKIDGIFIQPQQTNVQIYGILGPSNSQEPITVFVNMSMAPTDNIDTNDTIHSCRLDAYLGNPAYNMNYTIKIPNEYTFRNKRQWLISNNQKNQTTINCIPNFDPDYNDTSFTIPFLLSVGTTDPLAEFNEGYSYFNAYDSDGDGDYDYLRSKVKINATQAGKYRVKGEIFSSNGIAITSTETEKTLSAGSNLIQLSFDGDEIYRKNIDGPYSIVYDLSHLRNSSYIWYDSMVKNTSNYDYSNFTKPDIFFTGNLTDSGLDSNSDGKYDYLQIGLEVDVGELGYYEFEGRIETSDFSVGDQYITGFKKGFTFFEYDKQYVNLSFDGGSIFEKGANASIRVEIDIRSQNGKDLDEIRTMTDKYYYTEFSPPPDESCVVSGIIKNPLGEILDANIWLWDEITMSEKSTTTDENGSFSINVTPGTYELQINPLENSYDGHYETIELEVNETYNRNITILPNWNDCNRVEPDYHGQSQHQPGDLICINITVMDKSDSNTIIEMPYSNCSLEVYKEFIVDGETYGQQFVEIISNQTDSNGEYMFIVNTTNYLDGDYSFVFYVSNNSFSRPVAREDIGDIQIGSMGLEFDITKDKFRPGATGNGTYALTNLSDDEEISNANYSWIIFDNSIWGDYTVASGEFTNVDSGNGTFEFTLPSTLSGGESYDIELTAEYMGNEVRSSNRIDITEGSIIESVDEYTIGDLGEYDSLVYEVNINVTSSGTYKVHAGLNDPDEDQITFDENITTMSSGAHTVKLFFDGEQISASQADTGNWHSWIGLFYSTGGVDLDNYDYTTSESYNKSDFSTPAICFEQSFSNYTIEGENNLYSALIANATINASVCADYRVEANLNKEVPQTGGGYNNEGVAWNNSGTISISEGGLFEPNTSIVIPIRFEGSEIYNSGYDGPYNINFNLHRDYGQDTWITNYNPDVCLDYNYDDFVRPGAVIKEIFDYGSVGGDLLIGVNVNVSEGYEGDYDLRGDLQSSYGDWITWDNNFSNLENGTTQINLTFSGQSIFSSGFNGPYNLYISLENDNDWISNEFTTSYHSYDSFSTPGAIFEGSHTDFGYDEDNNGYYDYLQVIVPVSINETGLTYEVSGELYKETSNNWNWITWESEEFTPSSTGIYNVTLSYNANQISNSGFEGYYGANLWLRAVGGTDLDYIDFTTDNSYSLDDFEQPSIRFIENNSYPNDSNNSQYLNVSLKVNSSEAGSYYVRGNLHKVENQNGWDNWIWITDSEEEIEFTEEGEKNVTLQFDISLIQASEKNGPYTISFEIMDSNWNMLDNIDNYETDFYDFIGMGDLRPIYFTEVYDDYQRSSDDSVVVNVSVQVNQSGTYTIGGDLHKESGYNWNFIAGQWEDFTFTNSSSPQIIQLPFESLEILSGIQNLDSSLQSDFSSGTTFDIDIWVRRSGEWSDLDHLDVISNNSYQTSDFNTGGVTINNMSYEGYNNTGDSKFEYLNVTSSINFTDSGNYEVWCDLSKETSTDWYWLGWQGEYVTISDGNEEVEVTLQFNGERISSSGYDSPYNIHMEVENLDNGRKVARYDGQTNDTFLSTDFVGSSLEFNESGVSDSGVDTDNDGDYNYLSIDVPVSSQITIDCELSADLKKQTNSGDEWISWTNNWTTITPGNSTINIQFDSEIIRNSELDGPYTIRLELWDRNNWSLLDNINNYETSAYNHDNFDAPAASINSSDGAITDCGNDTDQDDLYDYLDVNVSLNIESDGYYRLQGDLYSDTSGWQWISNAETYTYLETTDDMAVLHFDGIKIRNKEINGPYKVRIELRQNNRMIDSYEPYETGTYIYDEFQSSGAEITDVGDFITENGDLQLNVTVNCSTSGYYWLGADLHKQSGWNWNWISWQSNEGNDEFNANEESNITILFSGQTIRNSGINGPYHVRLELRDVSSWTEQDMIERHVTDDYNYTDFDLPDISILSIENWGNDSDDADEYYNYLELNVTVNCSQTGNYWMHGDLEKRSGYNWQWITWKGQELDIDTIGEQEVKLKFDGERIYDSAYNGPYTVRLQIMNDSTWTMLDSYDDYSTNSYNYDEFQRSTVSFVENDTYPMDQGVGSEGSYSGLKLIVAINSSNPGDYWLQCDLHKESPGSWQWIDWEGETITHNGSGIEFYNVTFDGAQIRNKGIDGPYDIRIELNSNTGEWRQYDMLDHQTSSYYATDFASAGIEFVDMADGSDDETLNGNLKLNVSVNSSVTGKYKINGDLHQESGFNWQWISFNSTEITVSDSGIQNFNLIFDGSDIYESELDAPYHVRLELRKVGANSLIDTIDKYTTSSQYNASDFSKPSGSINETDETEDFINDSYLQVNISTYSATDKEYQYNGWLLDQNYSDVAWTQNKTNIYGGEEVILLFDGSQVFQSGKDPEKIYVEMRRTADWKLIDYGEYNLQGNYRYTDFNSNVSINSVEFVEVVDYDSSEEDGYPYYDVLNISANITFDYGTYELSAGLIDQNGSFITARNKPSNTYEAGSEDITFSFDGLKIYSKSLNGPYTVSYVSVVKTGVGELARVTNANTTPYYNYTDFEHYDNAADGTLVGIYSSYANDSDSDGDYDYLVVNVTINVTQQSDDFDLYADLYDSSGSTWITADSNNELHDTQWNGTIVRKLYFEGSDIYSMETDGPFMLGYVRLGAIVLNDESNWVLLDEASNAHTTSSYNYSDFENGTVSPLAPSGDVNITVSNDPFSPNSDGTKDTTLVTVTADTGQTLYLNIYNSSNVLKKTGLQLTEIGSGTYTATWNGKNDNDSILSDDTYRIKISDDGNGVQANESETTKTLVLDTTAPTGTSLEIESGNAYTNTTSVSLTTISATDTSDKKMRFKNAAGNYTDWEDFQSTRDWTLSSTDGSKTVYYQVKDVAGNIATAVSDSITLDTTKPSSVSLTITGKGDTPATYSNDQSVTLSISAEDATSGVEYMMIANEITFSGRSWEEYNTSKEWSLTSSNGAKTVYIKVKDRAGKVSDINSGNITLDTTSPSNLDVSINSDQTYTNSTTVNLTLSASDSYTMKMRFNNTNANWSNWESYNAEKANWVLTSGSGTKTVNFQVKDLAGNTASAVSDTIILDTTIPSISNVQSSGITQTSATITWSTDESSTSQIEYGNSVPYNDNTSLNSTKVKSHTQVITGLSAGTTYHYRVKSRDSAGNLANSVDKTFTTSSGADTTPPSAIVALTASDKTNAESTITISWNESEAPDFAGYKVYRKGSSFSNVTASNVQLLTSIDSRSTTSYDDTSVTDGSTYHYAVTAVDTATPPNENQTVTSVSAISIDDKAPVTTDNIPAGWQNTIVTITLTPTDDGQGVNKTYYTTDGSDPTNDSNLNRSLYYDYAGSQDATGPFDVGGENDPGDGSWTIKYYSYDKNSTANNESVNTETIRVDTENPSTTDNAPPGWQNTKPVLVTLNATDETSGVYKTYYTTDESDPTISDSVYSSSIEFSTEGNNTLKYKTKDNASNFGSINISYILIDTVRPTSEVGVLSEESDSNSAINVTWSSDDSSSGVANVTIQIKNGSGNWTDWLTGQNPNGYEYYTNGSIESTYYFRSIAIDNATNVENDYDSNGDAYTTLKPDALSLSISSPSNGDFIKDLVTFTGTVSGLNFSKYWLNYSSDNGVTWTNIENSTTQVIDGTLGTLNTTLISEVEYIIKLYALNESGGNNSFSINITVDNTAPEILTGPTAGSVDENSAVISWTTNETTNATVEYGTNESFGLTKIGETGTSHSVTLTSLSAETKYYYRIVSYDNASNMVNSSCYNFTTDEESDDGSSPGGGLPPAGGDSSDLSADAGGPYSGTVGESIDFSGTASNGTEPYTYSWDFGDGETSDEQNPTHIYSSADEYAVTLTVTDDADDTASSTTTANILEITQEDEAPTITGLSYGPKPATNEDTITITATVTDDNEVSSVTMYWSINEETQSSIQLSETSTDIYSTQIGPFEAGSEIEYSIDAIDNADQEASSSIQLIVIKKITSLTDLEDADETGVDGIDITTDANYSNVEVKIQKVTTIDTDSEYSIQTDEELYSYLEITVEADDQTLKDDDIDSIIIKFKVTQEWIDLKDINKSTVKLKRLHNGSWETLETTYLSEDSIYVYYQAEASGTSTFAVVGGKVVQVTPGSEKESDELPWILIIGVVVLIVILIIIFLFKSGFLYMEDASKSKKSKKTKKKKKN